MIYMPILYVMTYAILGSKEALWENQAAIFACFACYAIITAALFALCGKTPGYAYAGIILRGQNGEKAGFFRTLFRCVVFCASFALIFGIFVPLVWKNAGFLHDKISKTKVVKI